MARTRTTIRRIDPWSILKFGFVANLVLLGIQLLAGAVVWYVIQRLELIQTVCELAATVGFEECGVDGGALFDTFLVLGLLGVVIQTGIMVFLAFLANLIFDLTGGIVVTLEDDRGPARAAGTSGVGGVGSRATGAAAITRGSGGSGGSRDSRGDSPGDRTSPGVGSSGDAGRRQDQTGPIGAQGEVSIGSGVSPSETPEPPAGPGSGSGNDDTLFGNH